MFKGWLEEHEPQIKEIKYSLYLVRQSPLTMLGSGIILFVIFIAVVAPYIAPYDPQKINLEETLEPPSSKHYFGTDEVGRDLFSQILYGSRISLSIGLVVLTAATVVGASMGAIAGYVGGWIDELLMRITDVFFAIPGLILAMAVSAALGERSLQTVMIALTVVWWPMYARLIRGQALSVRENQYVEAAKSLGATDRRIIFKHVLPNTLAPLFVAVTMDMGSVILVAAGLSFIGFGAKPTDPEWGRMISDGRMYLSGAPWYVTFPGLAIFITVLGFNLLGDGMRDILDPRLRR